MLQTPRDTLVIATIGVYWYWALRMVSVTAQRSNNLIFLCSPSTVAFTGTVAAAALHAASDNRRKRTNTQR